MISNHNDEPAPGSLAHDTPAEAQIRAGLFSSGQIVATQSAAAQLDGETFFSLLNRHFTGDFGDLDDEDKELNRQAIADGSRILSAYRIAGVKYYVITEATDEHGQRYLTTVLRADEY